MSEVKTCHDCGKRIKATAQHCPYCGSKKPHKPGRRPTGLPIYIATAIAVFLFVFMLAYWFTAVGRR